MTRSVLCLALLPLFACGDKDGEGSEEAGTDDTGAAESAYPWGDSNCPDEVPEQFKLSWDCAAKACSGDTRMYRYGIGESDASGNIAVEETYFLFRGEDEDYEWCWDTFEIEGGPSAYTVDTFNCASCESIFDISWTLTTDNQCRLIWGSLFIDDDKEEDGPFQGVMMFDTHNSFGDRNPDDAALVYGNFIDGSYYYPDNSYARGTATPTSDTDGIPEAYEYSNSGSCLGSSSN